MSIGALPPVELCAFVDALAARIASYPSDVVAAATRAVDAAIGNPTAGLCTENQLFRETLAGRAAVERMRSFMHSGGQTREVDIGRFPI
jgi:hypothetical protein